MKDNTVVKRTSLILRLTGLMIFIFGVLGFQFAGNAHAATGTVMYAKVGGLSSGLCDSWANACNLRHALDNATSGKEIWVASGTYYPSFGAFRDDSFVLKSGVAVYGGFNGTETLRTERNPGTNVTILSGNIGDTNLVTDNSFHVVTGSSTDGTAVLDGFTITAGNANGQPVDPFGGGVFIVNGSPSLSNLIISDNLASYGGGVFNQNSSPTLTNVIIRNNGADRGGGMYNIDASSPMVSKVTFSGNTAYNRGGGMSSSGSNPILTNVTFHGNTAPLGGGLHSVFGSNPVLTNVTISGNSATTSGGAFYNEGSSPSIVNSILYGNSGGSVGEIFNTTSTTVTVTYSVVQGGYPGTGNLTDNPVLGPLQDNGGFTHTMALLAGSSAIDTGSDPVCPATDQRDVTRPQGMYCDMGAFEAYDTAAPILKSFTRQSPPTNPTNSDSLILRATFNEYVKNVDASDFTVNGSSATITNVNVVDARTYDITVSGGNLASFNGTVGLDLSVSQNIQDLADNYLSNGEPAIDETYTVDNIGPVVSSITRASANPTNAASVSFTVTFSKAVLGVDTSDFSLTTTNITGSSVSTVGGSGTTYTVSVNTGSGNGTLRLDVVDDNTVMGLAGNPLGGPTAGDGNFTSGQIYMTAKGFNPLSLWTTDFSYFPQGWRADLHPRVMGDVNGDGRDDIVGFGYGGILVGLSNGTGFDPVTSWTTDFSYNQGWRMDTYPRMVGDVNGDGKADIVGFGYAGAVVALSNGTSFAPLSLWTTDFSYYPQGWRADLHPRVMGDVNGDGKDDIVGFGYGGILVGLSNGTGFDPVTRWTEDFSYNQGWRMDTYPRMVGDVNGDGKDDIVGFGYAGAVVALSNGTSFAPLSLWTTDFSYYPQGWRADLHPRVMGDVNGDGRDDIVGFGYGGVLIGLSNGSGFYPVSSWTTDFSYNQGWRMDTYPRMVGDVNGDGKNDLVGFGYAGAVVATSK